MQPVDFNRLGQLTDKIIEEARILIRTDKEAFPELAEALEAYDAAWEEARKYWDEQVNGNP